jgi:hypothetical protein
MVGYGTFGTIVGVAGIVGVVSAKRADGKEHFLLLWAYFWLLYAMLLVAAFFCLATFYAGSANFSELSSHHWEAIKGRYPGLAAMNRTEAVSAVGKYYTMSFMIWGGVSMLILISVAISIAKAGTILTWEKVAMHSTAVINYFLLGLGTVALVFGFFMLSQKGLYGNSIWPPMLFFGAAWLTVFASVIGVCYATGRKRECLVTYMVVVAAVLLLLVVFCVYCIISSSRMAQSFDDVPDSIFANITSSAHLNGTWTRDNFKAIITGNFKYLGEWDHIVTHICGCVVRIMIASNIAALPHTIIRVSHFTCPFVLTFVFYHPRSLYSLHALPPHSHS